MATPSQTRTKRYVNTLLNQQVPQRAAVSNYFGQINQSGAGVVQKLNLERRSVTVTGVSGGQYEFFLQNRWIGKNEVVAGVGGRAL